MAAGLLILLRNASIKYAETANVQKDIPKNVNLKEIAGSEKNAAINMRMRRRGIKFLNLKGNNKI